MGIRFSYTGILTPDWRHVNMPSMKLPNKIRKYRKLKGLTQRDVERRARLPKTTLTRVETGRRTLGVLKLKAVARVLRVSMEDLLG